MDSPKASQMGHWLILLLASSALLTAFLLPPAQGGERGLQLGDFPLPPMCGFKLMTGLPCPGCGLTRSWVAAAHGDLGNSFRYNRIGWLVMAYAMAQALRQVFWLSRLAWRPTVDRLGKRLDLTIVVVLLLLLLNWLAMLTGILPKSLVWPSY